MFVYVRFTVVARATNNNKHRPATTYSCTRLALDWEIPVGAGWLRARTYFNTFKSKQGSCRRTGF